MKYKSYRFIDGKARWIIVDENGNIINKEPDKDELKGLDNDKKKVKICCNCESHDTYVDHRYIECWHKHKCQKAICTGYLCHKCYNRDYEKNNPNSTTNGRKFVANCRTGNQNPNCSITKGNKSQELACILYGWEDLNKKYNNYTISIDCYDPKTGLYHQVQGICYNSRDGRWCFHVFERERVKKYENMVRFCFSKDRKIVERIYKFPWKETMEVTGISIFKNPTDRHGNPKIPWYDDYRVKDEDELKKANEIWQKIVCIQ